MTTGRGVVRGRVPPTPPQRRHDVAVAGAIVLVVALVVGLAFTSLRAAPGADPGATADGEGLRAAIATAVATETVHPTPTLSSFATLAPTPTFSPAATVTPSPPTVLAAATPGARISDSSSPAPAASEGIPFASPGATDPYQLPRHPDAQVITVETGIDGSVQWTLIEYAVANASQDEVREHYRTVFRETDWFVGDVDFADGVWRFTANQDLREALVVITVDAADDVRVSAYVTEIDPVPAPTPTPPAVRERDRDVRRDRDRPRVQRVRPAPNRDRYIPRYRGDDDDDDDDGDDD